MSTYTAEQIERRKQSRWTIVQIVGAPIQLCIFLTSLGFVIYTLVSGGQAFEITNATVLVKILTLYFMFTTGALWEKDVFGHYVFAREFFWEDVGSAFLLATHTAYLVAMLAGAPKNVLLVLVLIAYTNYLINALQFFLKFWKNRHKRSPIREEALSAKV